MMESAEQAKVEDALETLLHDHDPATSPPREFLGAQYDAGLAWVQFPVGFGGMGLTASLQNVIDARLRTAGAPSAWENFQGVAQGAAAINAAGTDAQRARFLRPAFANEEMWCQLFSEPGAGSDLASLATRAERDGEEWVVNGQKVWTSGALTARWALLVARTDPSVPKHRGLTFFICDMRAAGIKLRPIRQADGAAHFNEVFLTDVRLPDWLRVGEPGQGWAVSLAGLDSERDGVALSGALGPDIDGLCKIWKSYPAKDSAQGRVLLDRLVGVWIEEKILLYANLRMKSAQSRSGPDSNGSLGKLRCTALNQAVANLQVDLMGAEGMLGGDYRWDVEGRERPNQLTLMRSRANTIEGGTSEIMRNIVGERVLGLPGEMRVDKVASWRDVPRN
jgi:alkylation response protein AidB-like acyl-CoA dehydrogenase